MTVKLTFWKFDALSMKLGYSFRYRYRGSHTEWYLRTDQVAEWLDKNVVRGQGNLEPWQKHMMRNTYTVSEMPPEYDDALRALEHIKKTCPDALDEFFDEMMRDEICSECEDRRRD